MERTRSKAKVAKAIENWKRLQELRKKEENSNKEPKLEKVTIEANSAQNSPPLKEIA
ncbi:hypothetical protein N9954_00610 [Maribacter sp.]|nr:hypothetical protein [Maribacter sp.]